jgi:hypothetical protein
MLEPIHDRTFRNTSLFIDGQRFVRCRFEDCQLIYEGRDEVDFQDCTFERCSWTFDGAAERTIGFLSTLQLQTGAGGPNLVQSIFENIQNRKVAEIRTRSAPTAVAISVESS